MSLWCKFPPNADRDNDRFPFYTGHNHLPEGQFIPPNHTVAEPTLEGPTMGVAGPLQAPKGNRGSDPPPSRRYTHNPYETKVGGDEVAKFVRSWPQGYRSTGQTAVPISLTGSRSAGSVASASSQGGFQPLKGPSCAGSQFLKAFALDYVAQWCPTKRTYVKEVLSKDYMQSVLENVGSQPSSTSWKIWSSESWPAVAPQSQVHGDWTAGEARDDPPSRSRPARPSSRPVWPSRGDWWSSSGRVWRKPTSSGWGFQEEWTADEERDDLSSRGRPEMPSGGQWRTPQGEHGVRQSHLSGELKKSLLRSPLQNWLLLMMWPEPGPYWNQS